MQDIIEGDDIPLWRLFAIALHAAFILATFALIPEVALRS
jgi:hypothetical protein